MHILFEELNTAQRSGGIESATAELCTRLRESEIDVWRTAESGLWSSTRLPDCVHFHGIWSPRLAKSLFRWKQFGVPCVVSPHGMLEPWALAHKRAKKVLAWHLYQKRLLNFADALHGTAPKEITQFSKLGLKRAKTMIPWGIEIPEVLPKIITEENATCQDRRRILLFIGRIYPVKGLLMLVEAWHKLRPQGWKVKIVGPDEAGHRAEVEALIASYDLMSDFEFTGPLTGIPKQQAILAADLYIQPSFTENFGMAIGEAMAHRLPVITTQGAPWELLEEEHCGWWVPVSVDDIATALDDATRRSPEALRAMGARGRTVVEQRFAWQGIAQQFIACYQWVLGQGAKPECVR